MRSSMCQNVTTRITLDTDQLRSSGANKKWCSSPISVKSRPSRHLNSDKLQSRNPKNIPEIFKATRFKYPHSTEFLIV